MNNPYRARPSRSRVEPTAVSNYGVQNRNTWGSRTTQQSIPPAGSFPPQHQIGNQPKQGGSDPWDWGTENVDNGNDSWNWSVDQQAETQQQQQQPPQFLPTYSSNNLQNPANPQQDNYFNNVNGNNRQLPSTQSHQADGNTGRNVPSREPTPHQQPDGYQNYANYGTNQQLPVPVRSNATKTNNPAAGSEHSQWPSPPPPQVQPQQQQQQNQSIDHQDRQVPSFNPYFPTNPSNFDSKAPASGVQQPVGNSYGWNVEADRTVQSQNWQNHLEVTNPPYWQSNANAASDIRYKNSPDNQWPPRTTQNPQAFANNPTNNQWQQQNSSQENEQVNQRQPSRDPSQNHTAAPINWNQPKSLNASQSWENPSQQEILPGQWSKQHSVDSTGNAAEIASEEDTISGRTTSKEWSQVKAPLAHFASSTASTTSGSIPNLSSGADQIDDRKKSLATSIASSASLNDSPTDGKAPMSYQSSNANWIPASETNSISDNSENIHSRDNHHEIDWNSDADWSNTRPIADLSTSISQLSLASGKSSQQMEIQSNPSYQSGQAILPEDKSIAVQASLKNPLENNPHEPPFDKTSPEIPAHPSYPMNPASLPEPAVVPPQTNYDQWYKQNSSQSQQQITNSWYSNDRTRLPSQPQWTPQQNVENYENIQQSTDFVNLEVVTPVTKERDIYGSRDSINRETLENEQKPVPVMPRESATASRDLKQETNSIEISQIIQQTEQQQTPENYEFASNDRNTFLETGELTDSHQEHESTPPSQDDENDEVPSDIPFLREVPGQSSYGDARRNRDDPTGQEQQIQSSPRIMADPRRNDPTGQAQASARNLSGERRDIPSGQERNLTGLPRPDNEILERRNDPSGRERSLPPSQSRNGPSGEERTVQSSQSVVHEASELREVPGGGTTSEESTVAIDSGLRQIPGGASPNEAAQSSEERSSARVVTGSQEVGLPASSNTHQEQPSEARNKREEAVGASVGKTSGVLGPSNRRDSYEDGDDEGSGNSRDASRERRRDPSPTDRRRYDYDRKAPYYDREREYDDDYYYDRRRGDYERSYNSREDLDRRDSSYREGERRQNSRDDLDRHARDDTERRGRSKDDVDERDGNRRRIDDRRRDRVDDPRARREREPPREFDSRYPRVDPRDREYPERRRDERRQRRYDDYDNRDPPPRRDYYEDPYARSSRPSSRSSYNDRDRDYYMRARDPYYGYNAGYNGYEYGANYNANYYTYLENLRRTNPAAYAEWYHKYYSSQHQAQVARGVGTNYQEDRASVHSGRSSCEDRLLAKPSFFFHAPNKSLYVSYFGYPGFAESPSRRRRSSCLYLDRTTTSEKRTLGDLSVLEDSRIVSSRLTPTKFSTSHVIGSLSIGSLLHVPASYPADGERAKVDILRLDYHLMHDPVARELRAYPGPLIKQVGVTHKKTIIEYCESKIKKAAVNEELVDKASYILLYELMIMLIQQNGNVVGVDIAQLLLRNKEAYPYQACKGARESIRRESTLSQRSGGTGGDGSANEGASTGQEVAEIPKQRKTVEQMTDEFRDTLLYGLVQEALEYAMTEGLWGHALFLASKLDKRTHASVMTRFANSLPAQDPLQTLYQLHSGRIPASVTCLADRKWDDWRPHLAMIISNTSANPEMNRRSIINLGDSLGARGDIHAAHFCYILAQSDFGPYGGSPGVKLVLIGSNHQRPYEEFVTPEAIMLTEIYEYARNLSEPGFTLVDLQTFKFESARNMADYGLMEKSLLYIEQIAVNIVNDPSKYKESFVKDVYTLGDRIKYHDPVCKDSVEDAASLTWLDNLSAVVKRYRSGEIVQRDFDDRGIAENHEDPRSHEDNRESADTRGRSAGGNYNEGPTSLMEVPSVEEQQTEWQPLSLPANVQDQYSTIDRNSHYQTTNADNHHYQQSQQQDYWNQQNYAQQEYQNQDYRTNNDWQPNQSHYQSEQTDVDSSQQQATWNYEPAPTISMGPSSGKQYDPLKELEALEPSRDDPKLSSESAKSADKGTEKKPGNAGSSWFGGLFSKLAPKPKNQMILPDDSNPTIVWDPVGKKWTNKDENGTDANSTLAPPPKASDMGFRPPQTESPVAPQQQEHQQQPPQLNATLDQTATINSTKLMSGSNMFKLPKGRNMRANYIDVMNPGGTKTIPTNASIPTPATSPLVPMAASSPQLFIPAPVNDPAAPVDFLTPSTGGAPAASDNNTNQGGPMMYNPTDVKDRPLNNTARSRYPPR